MARRLVYLASPYSHPDADERERRYRAACEAAALLMRRGFLVHSPIAHSHPIARDHDLPLDYDYWQELDERLLRCCDVVILLQIEGWKASRGVHREMCLARELGLPIGYLRGERVYE